MLCLWLLAVVMSHSIYHFSPTELRVIDVNNEVCVEYIPAYCIVHVHVPMHVPCLFISTIVH